MNKIQVIVEIRYKMVTGARYKYKHGRKNPVSEFINDWAETKEWGKKKLINKKKKNRSKP